MTGRTWSDKQKKRNTLHNTNIFLNWSKELVEISSLLFKKHKKHLVLSWNYTL